MGAERPLPRRPDQRPLRLPPSSWVTLVVSTGLALAAIVLFPRSSGDAPPLASLALIGAVVAGVTTGALYVIVRRDLRVPPRLAASLAFGFALIGIVKFVLAPLGLYEINAVRALDDVFWERGRSRRRCDHRGRRVRALRAGLLDRLPGGVRGSCTDPTARCRS